MIHPIINNHRPRPIPYKSGYVHHQHTPLWTITGDCYCYDTVQDRVQISLMMKDIVNSIREQYHLDTDKKQKCTLVIRNLHTNIETKCKMPLDYVPINVSEFCFDTLYRNGVDNRPILYVWFNPTLKYINVEMNLKKDALVYRTIDPKTGEFKFQLGDVVHTPIDWLKKHGFSMIN